MTSNLAQSQRSFRVIHFGGIPCTILYKLRPLIATFALSSNFSVIAGFTGTEPTV